MFFYSGSANTKRRAALALGIELHSQCLQEDHSWLLSACVGVRKNPNCKLSKRTSYRKAYRKQKIYFVCSIGNWYLGTI